MKPTRPGQIVKFHTPMSDEDPDQQYVVLEILKGHRTDARIRALNTGKPLAPVFVVDISDLTTVSIKTTDLTGHVVSIIKQNNMIVQGEVTGINEKELDPEMTITDQGININLTLTIVDQEGTEHTGNLIVK